MDKMEIVLDEKMIKRLFAYESRITQSNQKIYDLEVALGWDLSPFVQDGLLDIILDLLGVPEDSEQYCRDFLFDYFNGLDLGCSSSVQAFVDLCLSERESGVAIH